MLTCNLSILCFSDQYCEGCIATIKGEYLCTNMALNVYLLLSSKMETYSDSRDTLRIRNQ